MRELSALIERLERLDLRAVQVAVLKQGADAVRTEVRASLDHAPESEHATPWLHSGALRDSIAVSIEDTTAVVGSENPVALDQELGTQRIPPRPFLAPAAAKMGSEIAEAVGAAVRAAIAVEAL